LLSGRMQLGVVVELLVSSRLRGLGLSGHDEWACQGGVPCDLVAAGVEGETQPRRVIEGIVGGGKAKRDAQAWRFRGCKTRKAGPGCAKRNKKQHVVTVL